MTASIVHKKALQGRSLFESLPGINDRLFEEESTLSVAEYNYHKGGNNISNDLQDQINGATEPNTGTPPNKVY